MSLTKKRKFPWVKRQSNKRTLTKDKAHGVQFSGGRGYEEGTTKIRWGGDREGVQLKRTWPEVTGNPLEEKEKKGEEKFKKLLRLQSRLNSKKRRKKKKRQKLTNNSHDRKKKLPIAN